MTRLEVVKEISKSTGIDKDVVNRVVESFMVEVKNSLSSGNDLFLRGFGTFLIKERAAKTARNISKNTSLIIPAHNIPKFKPCKEFVELVKKNVKA